MTTPQPPSIDRPGPPPAPAAPMLRRSWPLLAAAAAAGLIAFTPSLLSRMDHSVPIAARDLTPTCDSLAPAQPTLRLPAGLPALDGQFVYQTGRIDRTVFTFTAAPDPDLDGVVVRLTGALRAAGYTVTVARAAPPAVEPPRRYDRLARTAVLDVDGPAWRGTVTVGGRCTTQTRVHYALTPP
jgi:hypothetical protein